MAVLNVQTGVEAGLTPSFQAAAGAGDSFPNSGRVAVLVRNTTAGVKHVNFEGQGTDNFGISLAGQSFGDLSLAVPAASGGVPGEKMIANLSQSKYNDANSRVQMTYPDDETGLSIALIAV